jgi:hypothetical protein
MEKCEGYVNFFKLGDGMCELLCVFRDYVCGLLQGGMGGGLS